MMLLPLAFLFYSLSAQLVAGQFFHTMNDFLLSSYQFELPQDRIAQTSAIPRDSAKLLVYNKDTQEREHQHIRDLTHILKKGDMLVLNDTKVFKARVYAISQTGRLHEMVLIPRRDGNWSAIGSQTRKLQKGMQLYFTEEPQKQKESHATERVAKAQMEERRKQCADATLKAIIHDIDREKGDMELRFEHTDEEIFAYTERAGEVPLPPYLKEAQTDLETYQTTFAKENGSVAAPTAGRHFTPELLNALQEKGVEIEYITLHVGIGTFLPVWQEDIRMHVMHEEWVEITKEVASRIRRAKKEGRRVIAVGTTVTRALEGAVQNSSLELLQEEGFSGYTDIFIAPGYEFKVIDGLMTNFHLPGTSLLMLVSALIGRETLLELYKEAIERKYRFYSLGDAMLIL